MNIEQWVRDRIKPEQIARYISGPGDFIPDAEIEQVLALSGQPDILQVRDILAKALAVERLTPQETAALMRVTDRDTIALMEEAALAVKKKVYDNRIVTFAPLYMSNVCVNNCAYCGFRHDNSTLARRVLTQEEVIQETKVLAGEIGHKRLIAVYGEHPLCDVDYMVETLKSIYSVRVPTRKAFGQIRRVNVNAAPMSIEDLTKLAEAGLGTYQVFQETYHKKTYERMHPAGSLKSNYLWRLYCMHRAFEAGIDDVGIGVLFGLYDWRFEVLAMVYHAKELEDRFGIGPHTVSCPRLEPAHNAPVTRESPYRVSDQEFKKIITVLRLAIPYSGMIITARETADIRRQAISLGITQTDASTRIGVGSYSERSVGQKEDQQQFMLGDTRTLDELIRELAGMGYITSFCTAGYRCGRTGKCIMELLKTGQEGKFCKVNAILTYKEWLDCFASAETRVAGERVLALELAEVKEKQPEFYPRLMKGYERIVQGERDIFF